MFDKSKKAIANKLRKYINAGMPKMFWDSKKKGTYNVGRNQWKRNKRNNIKLAYMEMLDGTHKRNPNIINHVEGLANA